MAWPHGYDNFPPQTGGVYFHDGFTECKKEYIYIYIQMFSLRCMTWRLEQEPLMVAVRACRRKGHKMDFAGAKLRNSEFGR